MQIRVNAESAAFYWSVCSFGISGYRKKNQTVLNTPKGDDDVVVQGWKSGTNANQPKATDTLIHTEKSDEQRVLALQ